MVYLIFLIVSFGASIAGAICGIGGGVIIKPALDAVGVLDVATISFLSGCTVLTMSCYSVYKAKRSGESLIDMKIGTPLAIGAAVGGVVGKWMFQMVSAGKDKYNDHNKKEQHNDQKRPEDHAVLAF